MYNDDLFQSFSNAFNNIKSVSKKKIIQSNIHKVRNSYIKKYINDNRNYELACKNFYIQLDKNNPLNFCDLFDRSDSLKYYTNHHGKYLKGTANHEYALVVFYWFYVYSKDFKYGKEISRNIIKDINDDGALEKEIDQIEKLLLKERNKKHKDNNTSFFLELQKNTILFAGPSDVSTFRKTAQFVADDIRLNEHDIDTSFAWHHVDPSHDDWEDIAPYASKMPIPLDKKCKGVVCVFGEKIGKPLDKSVPAFSLSALRAPSQHAPLHPWNAEHAQDGNFPLTASTYTLLAALAENAKRRMTGEDLIPILCCFYASASSPDIRPPENGGWGYNELRDLADNIPDQQKKTAVHSELSKQLRELHNLYHFLQAQQDIEIEFIAQESGKDNNPSFQSYVTSWLHKEIFCLTDELHKESPFKGFFHYEVEDYSIFFGRDDERQYAAQQILSCLRQNDDPHCYYISGESGAGKSSFLRAGIIGELLHRDDNICYIYTVLRPAELMPDYFDGDATAPLRNLLKLCLQESHKQASKYGILLSTDEDIAFIDGVLEEFDQKKEEFKPEFCAKTIKERIKHLHQILPASLKQSDIVFLIGFDQYEEIFHMYYNDVAQIYWHPVMLFIQKIQSSPSIMMIFTVHDGYSDDIRLNSDPTGCFRTKNHMKIGLHFSAADYRNMIHTAFRLIPEKDYVSVDDGFSQGIQKQIATLQGENFNSVLPLLSLTLERIYQDHILPLCKKKEENIVLRYEHAEQYGNIHDVVTNLIERAITKVRDLSGASWSDHIIGNVLRRFITWYGTDTSRIILPLATIPERLLSGKSAKHLIESLIDARLLIPSPDKRQARLIHQAVIHSTPAITTWMEQENQLKDYATILLSSAEEWQRLEYLPLTPEYAMSLCDTASEILALWYDILHDPWLILDSAEANILLRDYCLEVLRATESPTQRAPTNGQPTYFMIAASYGRTDIIKEMHQVNPQAFQDTDQHGNTALDSACFANYDRTVEALLECGLTPDTAGHDQWFPVHLAVAGDAIETLRVLHANRADINQAGPQHYTPLMIACYEGNIAAVEFLLEKGADIHEADDDGVTAFILACLEGHTAIVRLFLQQDNQLDINATFGAGHTALMIACESGHEAMTRLLLGYHADSNIRDHDGKTAWDYAADNNHKPIMRLLEVYQRKKNTQKDNAAMLETA